MTTKTLNVRQALLNADYGRREAAFRRIRANLRVTSPTNFVHAVSFIHRGEELEFAALEYWDDAQLDKLLDWLTDPDNPFTVTRTTKSRVFITFDPERS